MECVVFHDSYFDYDSINLKSLKCVSQKNTPTVEFGPNCDPWIPDPSFQLVFRKKNMVYIFSMKILKNYTKTWYHSNRLYLISNATIGKNWKDTCQRNIIYMRVKYALTIIFYFLVSFKGSSAILFLKSMSERVGSDIDRLETWIASSLTSF